MLKSWSLHNFKAILDSGQVQLAPITVLAGLNSSGKTSFLQSILLIAQTLSNPVANRALLPNGPIVQLGTFDELLNRSSPTRALAIGFEFVTAGKEEVAFDEDDEPFFIPGPYVRSIQATICFRGVPQESSALSVLDASRVYTASASFHLTSWDEIGIPSLLFGKVQTEEGFTVQEVGEETMNRLLKEGDTDQIQRFLVRSPRPRHTADFDLSEHEPAEDYLPVLTHFLPTRLIYRFSQREHQARFLKRELALLLDASQPEPPTYPDSFVETSLPSFEQAQRDIQHLFEERQLTPLFQGTTFLDLIRWYRSLETALPEAQFETLKEEIAALIIQQIIEQEIADESEEKPRSHGLDLQDGINLMIQAKEELLERSVGELIEFFTTKIRYLGPLRADPQATQKYPFANEFDDVGSKGEYAAAVYEANQEKQIAWYNPFTQHVEQAMLQMAVDSWAQYLGIAQRVAIETAGTSGFRWLVYPKGGQAALPLASVGIGVSQVLPLLVMGLVSPSSTLLLIEQPELHLHPRVQARLGDFFLGLAACQKHCLIETHGENLINQLRYHIVRSGGQEQSNCAIYFVQQDEQGATTFVPIAISPRGNILNWPDGFFDESFLQQDLITEESLKQRAKQAAYDQHSS